MAIQYEWKEVLGVIVGFKTRIYPNKEQEEILSNYCRIAHNMWNFLVAKYQNQLPNVNSYGVKNYTPKDLMLEFGVDIPQRIVLGVLKTYSQAVKRFWGKIGNKPKFHKYNPNKQSFYLSSQTYLIKSGTISIPTIRGSSFHGKSKNVPIDMQIIKKNNIANIIEPRFTCYKGQWYLSGSYKVDDIQKRDNLEYIGLDWGIKNFMTTSNGDFINYPKSVLREFQRINKLKHYRDKKIKSSNNWNRVNNKIIKAYERLENLKRDFVEQTTTQLCKNNNIVIEDLTNASIKMSNKKRRRLLQIAPLSRFVEKLQWKTEKFGTMFKQVNPAYTSRICSCCGFIKDDLKLSDRVFVCECGNVMDRDMNAARNLVAMAVCCSQ